MSSFGEQLRRERVARNVPLEEVARATKIGVRYLEALEHDDLRSLPGSVFNKGFVRAYAAFLGVDPEPLVEAYVHEEQAQEQAGQIAVRDVVHEMSASMGHRPARARVAVVLPARPLLLFGAVSLALLAAGGAYVWFRQPRPGGAEARPPARATVPRPGPPPAGPETPPPGKAATTREEATPPPPAAPPAAAEHDLAPRLPAPTSEAPPPAKASQPTADEVAAKPEPVVERPEPPPAESHLAVPEYGVGTAVVNRQLSGQGEEFAEGSQVVFWTRVVGGRRGDRIVHVWIHEGIERSSKELRLGGNLWRTYSRKRLGRDSAGRWAVEARDSRGSVLARKEFLCVLTGP